MNAPVDVGRFGSGHAVRRIEDPALIAGLGRFTDDVVPAGQTHLVFLRSPHAHARIVSIDTSAARAIPGVLAVWTGADLVAAGVEPMPLAHPFKRPDGSPGATPPRHVLAHERVRYVGEAVVAVVAETRFAALDGADAVMVDYEDLGAVVDVASATAPGRARALPGSTRQHRRRDAPRRRGRDRRGVREGGACRQRRHRQPAPRAQPDRAARRDGAGRRGDRPPRGAPVEPDADRGARRHRDQRAWPDERQRACARRRRRRRFRHEDRLVPGRHRRRVRGLDAQAPGQVGFAAARGVHLVRARPRPREPRRDGARRRRQGARAAHSARSPTSAPTPPRPAS